MNCHGCKYLDEVKKQSKGNGYCCMVDNSITQKGKRVRYSTMEKCELYESGDFALRYNKKVGDKNETDLRTQRGGKRIR